MNQMEAFKFEQKQLDAPRAQRDGSDAIASSTAVPAVPILDEEPARSHPDNGTYRTYQQQDPLQELADLERLVQAHAEMLKETSEALQASQQADADTATIPLPMSTTEIPVASVSSTSDDNSTRPDQGNISAAPTARGPAPRVDASESIYAFITRRLTALEGNSSLLARYMDEQSKVLRATVHRLEDSWRHWKAERELDLDARLGQDVSTALARLLMSLSYSACVRRIVWARSPRSLNSSAKRLAKSNLKSAFCPRRSVLDAIETNAYLQLVYERHRGVAQLILLLLVIVLGVATRSETIDTLLKPLLVEVKRRQSQYSRKRLSGPLSGLRIDVGVDTPSLLLSHTRAQTEPFFHNPGDDKETAPKRYTLDDPPLSPSPIKHKKLGRSNSLGKRPLTPIIFKHRRVPSPALVTTFRSFSTSDGPALASQRGPLDGRRRLAKSSHLHALPSDVAHDKREVTRTDAASEDDHLNPDNREHLVDVSLADSTTRQNDLEAAFETSSVLEVENDASQEWK